MNKKTLIAGAVSLSMLALAVTPVFAQSTTSASSSATISSGVSAKIACVGTAVAARETSLDSAMTTYTGALNSAYSTRASALQAAYAETSLSGVRTARNAAWSAFSASIKSARKTWQSARSDAWTTYRTAAVACKAPANTGDGTSSSLDVSGS